MMHDWRLFALLLLIAAVFNAGVAVGQGSVQTCDEPVALYSWR